jgi:hypothetical protein
MVLKRGIRAIEKRVNVGLAWSHEEFIYNRSHLPDAVSDRPLAPHEKAEPFITSLTGVFSLLVAWRNGGGARVLHYHVEQEVSTEFSP